MLAALERARAKKRELEAARARAALPATAPERDAKLKRADSYDPPPSAPTFGTVDRTPTGTVKAAKERLKRVSLSVVRRLEDLTEEARADSPPCPKCGRGMLREDELRLKAILGVLDRAGVSATRATDAGEAMDDGPLLVFPPGTRIAVVAQPTVMPEAEAIRVDVPALAPGPVLVRADLYDA